MTAAAPPAAAPSVTGVFVRLKLSLMRNGLRQSRGRTVGWCVGVGLAMLYALANGAGMIALRDNHYAPAVSVTVAVVLAVGWAVMPLFFFGGDDTLDPTRLAMLPLRPRPLLTALLTSSLIGVGPVFTVLLAAGAVTAVAHGPAAVVVAVFSVALLLVLCVALSRAVAAANTRLLTSRRGRDLALLSGLFVAVGAQLVNLGISSLSGTDGLHRATSAASVLRWIPPATAVDAVRSTGRGAYGLAAVQLAVTLAVVALVLRWWHRSLFRLMVSPDASTIAAAPEASSQARGPAAGRSRLHLRLPPGRTGTVMQRQFRYMWRDPRAKAALATGLAVGLLLPLVAVVQHGTVYQCLWAAGLLGIQMYNQFGLDGAAFWTVMATIADRRDAESELRGRALAIALIAVPYVTVVTTGAAVLLGQVDALAETLGLSFAFVGALVATGGFASVRFPYAVPRDNPFANAAPGQSGLVAINVFGGTLTGAALCLPVLAPVIALHLTGHHGLLWLALPVGTVYGAVLAGASLRLTAPRLLDRLPEILATVRG
ncbi:transporter [Streptomyces cocklensis]|jgi:ABC-2 type transport system permease protein|uniref:ABC-2 type transport system permease protein n=1 Tax=Actinacidiphila cocklensis TaxID=887465 RepID=A0A9W4DZ53_9ACTN|nr:transporter [Actinacidiphila cocklensis]MDD1057479.1 transporter [Actinacidiphila cocklensis]WSX78996.1 transporter [Streptomyces sp. NBC_00899]CAG6398826.1 ABC-2 type transport system permease protein [Actinacidiphila cocklensis]